MPDAKREQVLSVRDLDITFKTTAGPVHAIRGVNIDLYKGETVALVGESGSGKTTLLRCLNFLETADAGTLTFDGEAFDLARADRASIARLRRKTAFVFQN